MQFSYKVSEADYRRALRLRVAGGFGKRIFRTTSKVVLFWVFILVCLMMLWAVVERTSPDRSSSSSTQQSQESLERPPSENTSFGRTMAVNVGPFVLIGAIWVFMLYRLVPSIGRQYRKDPAMQGVYTIDITPSSLSIQNTSGFSTQSGWNLYDYWMESKTTTVLVYKSGAFFVISTDALSDPQRSELCGILGSVVPKK